MSPVRIWAPKVFYDPRRQQAFDRAVFSLARQPFACPQFFARDEIDAMRDAALALPFRRARAVAGAGISQDFDICFPAPLDGVFANLATALERHCAALHSRCPDLFDQPVRLNDFAVQRYAAGARGIGVHKDNACYRQLIFIITLAGQSELFVCRDRQGRDRQIIDDQPGHLVILPAPGCIYVPDPAQRPFHGVDNVTQGRLSLGLRFHPQTSPKE